jgi:UDP:flavonoid glycosyltransferase YjiC (YdhE family)
LKVNKLRAAVERVLAGGAYTENARRLRDAIARCGGVRGTANRVEEQVLRTMGNRPANGAGETAEQLSRSAAK